LVLQSVPMSALPSVLLLVIRWVQAWAMQTAQSWDRPLVTTWVLQTVRLLETQRALLLVASLGPPRVRASDRASVSQSWARR